MWLNRRLCKIIKYVDDTIIIGLINDNEEIEYGDTIKYAANWCIDNYIELNMAKTKEIIFDFRKNQNDKSSVIIDGSDCQNHKFL